MVFFMRSFFFSSRRRHTRSLRDWSSDVCSSDLVLLAELRPRLLGGLRGLAGGRFGGGRGLGGKFVPGGRFGRVGHLLHPSGLLVRRPPPCAGEHATGLLLPDVGYTPVAAGGAGVESRRP